MATDDELDELAWVFATFAEETYHGSSPLYYALAKGISEDRDLLEIASSAHMSPVPNLLFGAVHYLLLGGTTGTLVRHYPSLTDDPFPPSGAYAHFRKFCLDHEDEIRRIMATRLVQTNVVERCSYLLPAFALIAEEVPGTPLSLIDVGTSAGLSLLWDRYQYVYGGRIRAGLASSPVRIEAEVRGKGTPPIPHDFPTVAYRAGIDLHPVDMADPESALWLRALNWPEHQDRAAQLQAAIALVQHDAPELVEGDAVEVLAQVVNQVPAGSTLCIFHNSALIYFPKEGRRKFGQIIEQLSLTRDIYWLSAEGRYGYNYIVLELVTLKKGVKSFRELAKVDHHGRWLEWMLV